MATSNQPRHVVRVRLAVTVGFAGDKRASPFGARFQRGAPLPMAEHAEAAGGYYFETDDYDEACECARLLQKYLDEHVDNVTPTKAKKKTSRG